ncbi:NADH-quinone oxidoreductase subunit NuoK [Deferrisoma camini]|uniref:NADH-quinone oxidoreductase subunit NuoK n=1 Tax=Deferrisoma camini TaxID=1035120 RepID=UPI00046D19F7|nr:NADH-quinone oxidoreductase subunit NuoK [Deferrisoma camini]
MQPAFFGHLEAYLLVALCLFALGLYGLVSRPGFISMLISVELILNAAGLNFVAFNTFLAPDKTVGQTFTLFIMGLAAAEAAICLSIAVVVYRRFRTILADEISELKD